MICPACGTPNRAGARFCLHCALVLAAPQSQVRRPATEDIAWLAATLVQATTSTLAPTAAISQTAPLTTPNGVKENRMDQAQTAPPTLFGGRYEIVQRDAAGRVEVIDRQPSLRCWACGSTSNDAGEIFCTNCGASLEQRTYRGTLTASNALEGLALITAVRNEAAQAILPALWDDKEADGQRLVLLHDSRRTPISLPLDELGALRIGLALAQLLIALHNEGLALGSLTPADLELTVAGQLRLRDASGMVRFQPAEKSAAVRTDLRSLTTILEALTETPRTTRRLDEDQADDGESGLAIVLRQIRTDSIVQISDLIARLQALIAEQTNLPGLQQRVGSHTDKGIVRDHNEDSFLTLSLGLDNTSVAQTWGCYIVADGMGGHAGGEVASGLAIRGAAELVLSEYLALRLDQDTGYDEPFVREVVRRAILQANERILQEARIHGNDMGSTLTMALVIGDRALIGNVGDSRTYLYREGKLRRISKDHSLVMRLVELGQISDADIYTHPQRNAVLRSLGDKPEVEIDLFAERLRPGDALFLCSDGQWEMTRDPDMERILAQYDDPESACRNLIEAANQAGGEDNITVVLVKFV